LATVFQEQLNAEPDYPTAYSLLSTYMEGELSKCPTFYYKKPEWVLPSTRTDFQWGTVYATASEAYSYRSEFRLPKHVAPVRDNNAHIVASLQSNSRMYRWDNQVRTELDDYLADVLASQDRHRLKSFIIPTSQEHYDLLIRDLGFSPLPAPRTDAVTCVDASTGQRRVVSHKSQGKLALLRSTEQMRSHHIIAAQSLFSWDTVYVLPADNIVKLPFPYVTDSLNGLVLEYAAKVPHIPLSVVQHYLCCQSPDDLEYILEKQLQIPSAPRVWAYWVDMYNQFECFPGHLANLSPYLDLTALQTANKRRNVLDTQPLTHLLKHTLGLLKGFDGPVAAAQSYVNLMCSSRKLHDAPKDQVPAC
jgi:hypothetical protein